MTRCQSAAVGDERTVRGVALAGDGDIASARAPVARVDAVGDDLDVIDGEEAGHLAAHVRGAGDHGIGGVREPALDRVDRARQLTRQPALMAAGLGRVQRRHEGHPPRGAQQDGGVGHHPVVGVHDVGPRDAVVRVADIGRHARQRGKGNAVVRPVDALGGDIGVARPRIEMRHVEHEQVEPRMRARQQAAGAAEIIRPAPQFLRA